MYEYRITVAINGKFLFSTEWSDDKEATEKAYKALQESMPHASVYCRRKDKTTHPVTF